VGGYLVAAGLVALGAGTFASTAGAVVAIDDGAPGILQLETEPLPEWTSQMDPGDEIHWPITTVLEAGEPGELGVRVEYSGGLTSTPSGLRLAFESCAEPWSDDPAPQCALGATTLSSGPINDISSGTTWNLGEITPGVGPYFLATLSLPEVMSTDLQGQDATVAFGFTALGDTASVTSPPGLPLTGLNLLPGAWLASGIILGGLVLARQRAGASR
jgi:hypothetical protein